MNLKSKKILITGATGGIGNHLVKKFVDSGAKFSQPELMKKSLTVLKKLSKYNYWKI